MKSLSTATEYECRDASHAGSWYSEDEKQLDKELSGYIDKAKKELPSGCKLKGVIGPHAGFYYSGPTAAWAYINIDPTQYQRVILLGPSHHVYLDNCALSKANRYATPLGDIEIDRETTQEIEKLGNFIYMSKKVDEQEHSLEMHIPYIKKIFGDHPFKLVPIMIGNLSAAKEKEFGKKLAPYLLDD